MVEIDDTLAGRLAQVQRRLLAADLESANTEVLLSEISALVGADAAMGAWLDGGRPWLVTWRAGPQISAYLEETFAGVDCDGNIRSAQP